MVVGVSYRMIVVQHALENLILGASDGGSRVKIGSLVADIGVFEMAGYQNEQNLGSRSID